MIKHVDIVCDLSWGDTGKGKITNYLSSKNRYDVVARWAGGNNAGHTIWKGENKYKTHLIPSGIFNNTLSVIGPSCVLNEKSFYEEIDYLKESGFNTSLVKVSPRTHIVLEEHIKEDKERLYNKLGTTAKGIAPCYASKMARTGVLAKDVLDSKYILKQEELSGKILCEGAQGFYLDIDWGNYPYVTSSITLPYGACSLGFSPHKIKDMWGITKAYDTRSGNDPLFPDTLFEDKDLYALGLLGEETGVTTGRKRKVDWLNLDYLIKAIRISGVNILVVNKCDVLRALGIHKLFYNDRIYEFESIRKFTDFINCELLLKTEVKKIHFSFNKEQL